ncbi:MAG: hypothetical protein IJB47_02015 [Oscillospiraceae bacterium]|nr:hypothetical protein [Oscillospiraceae bacterium]
MLFRKRIPRSCAYCTRAAAMDADNVLCAKRGVVSALSSCKKFRYDPYKRIPPKMKVLDLNQYEEADFTLQ